MSEELFLAEDADDLFQRVASIIEEARANTARAVNISMVASYWLIGREIVQVLQEGDKRAAYGKSLINSLSGRLTQAYGRGFSAVSLWNFRQFYQCFSDRPPEILSLPGRESQQEHSNTMLSPAGRESSLCLRAELSWSHYRALMRVKSQKARDFFRCAAKAYSYG